MRTRSPPIGVILQPRTITASIAGSIWMTETGRISPTRQSCQASRSIPGISPPTGTMAVSSGGVIGTTAPASGLPARTLRNDYIHSSVGAGTGLPARPEPCFITSPKTMPTHLARPRKSPPLTTCCPSFRDRLLVVAMRPSGGPAGTVRKRESRVTP